MNGEQFWNQVELHFCGHKDHTRTVQKSELKAFKLYSDSDDSSINVLHLV